MAGLYFPYINDSTCQVLLFDSAFGIKSQGIITYAVKKEMIMRLRTGQMRITKGKQSFFP